MWSQKHRRRREVPLFKKCEDLKAFQQQNLSKSYKLERLMSVSIKMEREREDLPEKSLEVNDRSKICFVDIAMVESFRALNCSIDIGKKPVGKGKGRMNRGKKGPVKAEDLDRELGMCK
jgi:hypothetical protein